jgi:hypothetical protein
MVLAVHIPYRVCTRGPPGRRATPTFTRTHTIWLSRDSSTIFDDPATVCVIATISMFPLFT